MLFCFIKPTCVILLLPEIILGKRIRENGHSSGNGYRKTEIFALCLNRFCSMVIKFEVFENNNIIILENPVICKSPEKFLKQISF